VKALIAGAGIGGIVTALMLRQRGIACAVYEQVAELKELGVGITLLPHAVRQLADLDLLPALDAVGIRGEHLYYATRRGQTVWDEPRGMLAGYDVPQFFIHRGKLHATLFSALRARLPPEDIHLGHRLAGFHADADGVTASFVDRDGRDLGGARGDMLIGADGIHSRVRQVLRPEEGNPRWSGLMLWRGATDWPVFLGGASVMICGGVDAKFVTYPIGPGLTAGTRLTNWAVVVRIAPDGSTPPRREDWSRVGRRADLLPMLDRFSSRHVDFSALVAATPIFWEYPLCDRDPIGEWSRGRVTLLGDAAHPMYPMGANGASQAILDARCLADLLLDHRDPSDALAAYDADRAPHVAAIVLGNRKGGPESIIDAVESRAPDGFDDVETVLGYAERYKIMAAYPGTAAFAREQGLAAGTRP
jgi:2-polyprenyl-6-methoxyphenol hydroxylase-like FAD-dependent oxidoreductase